MLDFKVFNPLNSIAEPPLILDYIGPFATSRYQSLQLGVIVCLLSLRIFIRSALLYIPSKRLEDQFLLYHKLDLSPFIYICQSLSSVW